MKSVVLIVALIGVACIASVSAGTWGAYTSCSRPCDVGVATRTCDNSDGVDCVGSSTMLCNTQACKNCTVSGWSGYSQCTKICGTGTQFRYRTITQKPTDGLGGVGGTPCPATNVTTVCNTGLCSTTLQGMGYVYWGPLTGPGPLQYTVARQNTEVDVFIFDQANFFQYQYDAARTVPYETGYTAVQSSLNVENSNAVVTLGTTGNYYFVVDHTLVGAAQGTTQNGVQVFNNNPFAYALSGLPLPLPMYVYPDGMNAAGSASSPAIITLVAMVTVMVALLR